MEKKRNIMIENARYKSLLNEENLNFIEELENELKKSNISDFNVEKLQRDTAKKLYLNQEQGNKLNDVISASSSEYCLDLVSSIDKLTPKQQVAKIVLHLLYSFSTLLLIKIIAELLDMYFNHRFVSSIYITLGELIASIIITIVTLYMFNRLIYDEISEKTGNRIIGIYILTMLISIILVFILDFILLTINFYLLLFIFVLMIILVKVLHRYVNYAY